MWRKRISTVDCVAMQRCLVKINDLFVTDVACGAIDLFSVRKFRVCQIEMAGDTLCIFMRGSQEVVGNDKHRSRSPILLPFQLFVFVTHQTFIVLLCNCRCVGKEQREGYEHTRGRPSHCRHSFTSAVVCL
jgi:hypothetical protein